MCGRYAIVPDKRAWAPLERVFSPGILDALRAMQARFNVAPTQSVPIIYMDRDTREVKCDLARWGFIPHWWKNEKLPTNTINARVEEAARKPMWREAWKNARCLIPATHWYEWRQLEGHKQPHALTVGNGEGFMFAGLFSFWRQADGEPVLSCAILTRDAAPSIAELHDRMPLILSPRLWEQWIDRGMTDLRAIDETLGINAEVLDVSVESFPIRPLVNSPKNQGPEILRRDDEPDGLR